MKLKLPSVLLLFTLLIFPLGDASEVITSTSNSNDPLLYNDVPENDRSRDGEGDTFSIVAYDPVTGEVGGAGCSCFSGTIDFLSDLVLDSSNNIIGGIHTQASYQSGNQNNARTRMLAGDNPAEIVTWLANNDCCSSNPNSRQYGVVGFDFSTSPPTLQTAGFTGSSNGNYANDLQGPTYAIQGNILDVPNGQALLEDMEAGFLNTPGTLADKLMGALQGAKRVGGDNRCQGSGISGRAAFVKVLRPGDTQPYIDISLYPNTSWIEPIDELQCAYDNQITPPTCRGTVSSFPYAMDFEELVWVKDESNCGPAGSTNSWIRTRFNTPTTNTGPSGASQGQHYMFIEGSQGNNDRAIIVSPCFVLPVGQAQSLTFDYHMFGTNIGSLSATINDGTGWSVLWSETGNQGDQWLSQTIDLSAYQGDTVRIRFDGITGGGVASDMAVDNIRIGEPLPANCNNVVSDFPYAESFESNFGLWEQSSQDDLNWTRDASGTPSSNTGPSSAFDGTFYIYVEASGNGTGYPNKRAILTSPCYDLTGKTAASFDFNYHMFGSNDMGSIDLEASTNGTSWTSLWNRTGNQGNQWLAQSIDLSAYLGEPTLLLRWNRLTGGTWQADIAIDNIILDATGGPDIESPTAPTNLTAANTTTTTTDLSWNASTDNIGVTDYDVYEGATVIGNTTGTTFNVTGLTPSTSYAFTVVAKDAAANESAPSNTANVTTDDPPDTEAPSVPINLAALNTTTTGTDLSWDPSTDNVGVTEYDVFQDTVLIATTATESVSVSGLNPSTAYSYTVLARDAAGNESAQSSPLLVNTLDDTTPPSTPTNLTASNTTQTTTDLSWTASTDDIGVTGYDVYEGILVIGTTAGTTFDVTGLAPSTSYSFTVVAKDAAGNESAASNAANITTDDPPDTTPPTAPTGLMASNTTTTTTDLSWTASSDNVGVTGYDVYLGATVIGSPTGTTFNVTGLSPSTNYTFSVVAKDAAGNESVPSDPLGVTTLNDTSPPTAPTALSASNTTTTTTDLSWNASSDDIGVDSYDVYEGATVIGNTPNTTFGVTGLTPSASYAFTVVGKDAAGNESAASNVANVTTEEEASGCTGGTASYPYTQGFEGSVGDWIQGTQDDLDWIVNSGGTPSNNTGPLSADEGTFYIFVEASGNGTGYPNKQATLLSPCFDLSAETAAYFNFSYHAFGNSDMGSISLRASGDDGITWDLLWSQTVNQPDAWQQVSVDLSAYLGSGVLLEFDRVTGGSWQSDLALDNISMTNVEVPSCSGGLTLPYSESLESSFGAWTQSSEDDLDWLRISGATPSNNTGPTGASDGSVYAFVEASGNGTGYPNKRAILNSPCFDLSPYSSASISFDYHMYGTTDMGIISLEASDNQGQSWTPLWSQTVNQGPNWISEVVDLSAYVGNGLQLRFNRLSGGTWRADVAVDNLQLVGTVSYEANIDPNVSSAKPRFNLYPNPVKGSMLYLSTNTSPTEIEVFTITGQQVIQLPFTENLDVSGLSSGVYFIRVSAGVHTFIERFIKE